MCGSATLTMVASSTTMSCAVAITAEREPEPSRPRAPPRLAACRRRPRLTPLSACPEVADTVIPLICFRRSSPTYCRSFRKSFIRNGPWWLRSAGLVSRAGQASLPSSQARLVSTFLSSVRKQCRSVVVERVHQGILAASSRISRSFAAMPSGVRTRFLTRRSRWLGSRRANPSRSSVSAISVTNDASHPICCASSFIVSTPSSLNRASRSCGAIPNSAAIEWPIAPLLDQAGERVEDVPVQRRCRSFSPRRVRSLDLNAHDLLNS